MAFESVPRIEVPISAAADIGTSIQGDMLSISGNAENVSVFFIGKWGPHA